jgi:hypothetical protein
MSDEADEQADDTQEKDSPQNDTGKVGVSRRTLLGGAAGIGIGSILGVGYAVLSDSTPGRTIEPVEPNDDGEATVGELHYILENSGPEHSQLDVTQVRYFGDDNTIKVSYRTGVRTVEEVQPQRQHVREVGQIVRMYATYVSQNGEKGAIVQAHIENPSEAANQPDGYVVRREWVQKFNSDEWSANRTLNKVLGTGYQD